MPDLLSSRLLLRHSSQVMRQSNGPLRMESLE